MMPDWPRIFPEADHRWIMGLRRTDSLADYFADADPSGAIRAERAHWLTEDPDKYAALLPAAELALSETVEMAQQLGATVDSGQTQFEQLLSLGRWWELDFVLMNSADEGRFQPAGGVVCFPSSWALEEKMHTPMRDVHNPVPELNTVLGRQIDTFLTRLVPGEAWRRENWSLARDGNWNHHPSRPRQKLDGSVRPDEVWLRLEHQLLLKLPRSHAVFFGIRMEVIPLQVVLQDSSAAKRFARILSTIAEEAAVYKGFASARAALVMMLEQAIP
jgi:hypothetical protein